MRFIQTFFAHRIACGAAALAIACAPALQAQQTSSAHNLLVPAKGAYLGAWVYRAPDEKTALGLLESQIGRNFAIALHYAGWNTPWPNEEMQQDIDKDRIPLLSWNCGDTNEDVAAGKDDAMLVARAKDAKQYGRPIFLRYYWEFNLPEGQKTGHCLEMEAPLDKKQADFIAAWRHIWTIFHDNGAENVVWVWNPNSMAPPGALDPKGFYPGDQYVDWVGFDKYDQKGGTPFAELFDEFIKGYAHYGKPMLIGETGAHPEFQASFLAQATAAMKGPDAQIKAIMYFDAPGHRPLPWTLSPEGIAAMKTMGADPFFAPMEPKPAK